MLKSRISKGGSGEWWRRGEGEGSLETPKIGWHNMWTVPENNQKRIWLYLVSASPVQELPSTETFFSAWCPLLPHQDPPPGPLYIMMHHWRAVKLLSSQPNDLFGTFWHFVVCFGFFWYFLILWSFWYFSIQLWYCMQQLSLQMFKQGCSAS